MNRGQYLLLVLILGLLTATDAFSIDSSLPAMPAIARALGTSDAAVQLSLSAFMFGVALGQLVYGPMSDRFGRKPVLLIAAGLFTVASIGCLFANDVQTLTAFRFVQGIAGAAGQILTRAIARDLFERELVARLMSYTMVVLAVAPIVAPILGAHLTLWFGWRSIFVFLTLYGAAVLVLNALFLRESLSVRDEKALRPSLMLGNYAGIIRNRAFLGYLICASSGFAGLFAFLTGSPWVIISFLGVSADRFGYYFALSMTGHMVALILAGRYVVRLGIDALLRTGILLAALGGGGMGILAWSGVASVPAIVVPAFVYLTGFSLIVPQAMAGALSPFARIAGSASSLLGFLQVTVGALTAALVGAFSDGTQVPMTTAIFLASVTGLVGYFFVVPKASSAR